MRNFDINNTLYLHRFEAKSNLKQDFLTKKKFDYNSLIRPSFEFYVTRNFFIHFDN